MRLALPVRTELRPICDVPARARLAASVSSSQPPLRHEFVGLQSKRAGRKEASAKRRALSLAVAPFRARGRVQLPQVEHITRITDPSLARHAASCSLGALPAAQVARSAGFRAPVASTQPRLFFEAFIKIAGTQENLGFFDDGEDAAQAYDTWARKLNRILDLEPK